MVAAGATDGLAERGSCWPALLRSPKACPRLFAAVHAWRAAVLRRKHRYQPPTSEDEALQVALFEEELPLHVAVLSLETSSGEGFELLGYISSRFSTAALRLDAKRRSALFYAIRRRWRLEQLEWLADKSAPLVLEKDNEGLGIVTHAVLSQCSQELVLRLAVAAALQCVAAVDDLLQDRHFLSARRYCHRSLADFFAGVPKFPYSQSQLALAGNPDDLDAVSEIRELWARFAGQWGHGDAPVIQHDLPPTLRAPIESSVEVSITAKGEPLTYQWFCNGIPIEGATSPLFYLAQSVQPHNAGVYHCETRNRKGRTLSTAMDVQVVDDRELPDPTRAFRVDKSLIRSGYDAWRNVKAATGALVCHDAVGATVLLPPGFFECLNGEGNDVSNSLGVDIAIRNVPGTTSEDGVTGLRLRGGDQLVSCVVDILPHTVGDLLLPVTISIPHCLATTDRFYRPVVVEIDVDTGKYKDIETLSTGEDISTETSWTACACVRVPRLGRFAVVAKKLPGNLELEPPLERLQLVVVRPRSVPATLVKTRDPRAKVSLWLIQDRPDVVKDWEERVVSAELEPGGGLKTDRFPVQARRGQVVCVQLGSMEAMVVHHWRPLLPGGVTTDRADAGIAALASSASVRLENSTDNRASTERSPFCSLPINVSVRKLTQTLTSRNREVLLQPGSIDKNTVLLGESSWETLIPIEYDEHVDKAASTPALRQRTSSHLELDLEPNSSATDAEAVDTADDGTPYYYVVELATFSASFWSRYDTTWWFDKTKTAVIDGMFKVVHHGYDRTVTIATRAFAGCVRIARCSVDSFGSYSEPLLIEPLSNSDGEPSDSSGPVSEQPEGSQQLQDTVHRLDDLVRAHYQDEYAFRRMFGTPPDASKVSTKLKAARTEARAVNYELLLLLLGISSLKARLALVHVASTWYTEQLECVAALERFVPELDRSPVRFAPVIGRMHRLVQGQWFLDDIAGIQQQVVNLFTTDAKDLRGALEFCQLLAQRAHSASDAADLLATDRPKIPWTISMTRRYLLLIAGGLSTQSQAQPPDNRRAVLDALCRSLALNSSVDTSRGSEDHEDRAGDVVTELQTEVEAPGFQDALTLLRLGDSLHQHLLRTTPADGEACTTIPAQVTLFFDDGIVGLSDAGPFHAVKVVNLSRDWSSVQGKIELSNTHAALAFVPAVPFEKQCRYRVLVKPHELVTSLGAPLPKTEDPIAFHFSTPA